jgi:hypothetical protein
MTALAHRAGRGREAWRAARGAEKPNRTSARKRPVGIALFFMCD